LLSYGSGDGDGGGDSGSEGPEFAATCARNSGEAFEEYG
jgi:hypothetical protein